MILFYHGEYYIIIKNTREAFTKVSSQVKKGGMLHVMVYNKKYDHEYDGYRGDTSIEKHKEWEKLSFKEKIKICENKVKNERRGCSWLV